MCRLPQATADWCQGCTIEASDRLHAAVSRDLCAQRREFVFLPPLAVQWHLRRLLSDPRDAPNAFLLFDLLATVAPATAALFALPPSHYQGAAHLTILYAVFLARFLVALLHVTQHRHLFKRTPTLSALSVVENLWDKTGDQRIATATCRMPGAQLHRAAPPGAPVWRAQWPVRESPRRHAPYSEGTGLFRLCLPHSALSTTHAQGQHGYSLPGALRQEGNHAHDLSSTEPYQRDNPLHFLLYVACQCFDTTSCYMHTCMSLFSGLQLELGLDMGLETLTLRWASRRSDVYVDIA